jgi:NAD(P)-dependent dehydrogenase (short-subunit alcohol dehydrogenase family)
MPLPLDGQIAIVTGGARGQGRAHAVALAGAGASVVVCDGPRDVTSVGYPLGTSAELADTVSAVEAVGGKALAVTADVRRAADVERVAALTLEAFGHIDVLVANAGIVSQGRLEELTDVAWQEMIDTNLTGVFHSLRAVVPSMRAQQYGRIVVISSLGGRVGLPTISHYAAAKWGTIGLAKSLALEVAEDGITVNVVCPTTVRTPMVTGETADHPLPSADAERLAEQMMRHHPIKRPWVEAEDVSREVLHLVTERGNITGAVVEIGLGQSAQMH